jgi:hypothetical protein
MYSVQELRAYADEHLDWARTARTDRERRIFLQMAWTWLEIAIQLEGVTNNRRTCPRHVKRPSNPVRTKAAVTYLCPSIMEPGTSRALYAADNSIGSRIEGSSFSGLLTRVEIGHIRIGSAGNGPIRSRGSYSSLSQRT